MTPTVTTMPPNVLHMLTYMTCLSGVGGFTGDSSYENI